MCLGFPCCRAVKPTHGFCLVAHAFSHVIIMLASNTGSSTWPSPMRDMEVWSHFLAALAKIASPGLNSIKPCADALPWLKSLHFGNQIRPFDYAYMCGKRCFITHSSVYKLFACSHAKHVRGLREGFG